MPETVTYTCRHCLAPVHRGRHVTWVHDETSGLVCPGGTGTLAQPILCPGLDEFCPEPAPSNGRPFAHRGETVGRLCPEHSAEAGVLMAEAREFNR